MKINPNWRILTIGDGDLSFSHSLLHYIKPSQLVATVLDSFADLTHKYEEHCLERLNKAQVTVLDKFDVMKPASWGEIPAHSFDLVIFQFPLVPNFSDKESFQAWQSKAPNGDFSVNTVNRYLLHCFLKHAFHYFLAPDGANLAYISSKDVKPYNEWDIERSLVLDLDCQYLGKLPFFQSDFPQYRIRNVDRDKWVKDTQAYTYVWSNQKRFEFQSELIQPSTLSGEHCEVCLAGPFATAQEKDGHMASKRHQLLTNYQRQWLSFLRSQSL